MQTVGRWDHIIKVEVGILHQLWSSSFILLDCLEEGFPDLYVAVECAELIYTVPNFLDFLVVLDFRMKVKVAIGGSQFLFFCSCPPLKAMKKLRDPLDFWEDIVLGLILKTGSERAS